MRTVFNPYYKVADNTGSLFMAREELAGDCLVWNGDTLVSRALMAKVVGNERAGICVTIDLKPVSCGTDLNIVQEGVPDMIPAESCYLGWQESLTLLAQLVEPEISM